MANHSRILIRFACFILISMVIADREQVISTSGSGVCFYGKTAERVLSIIATGKHRALLPSVHYPKDCSDLKYKRSKSGVYRISPDNVKPFKVYCDMETDGGSWTVIQRRHNGKTDFYRGWKYYEDGFGSLDNEFWLGNSKINILTMSGDYELRIDFEDFSGNKAYAKYSTFNVGDASTKYKLLVSGYSGTAGDSLTYHNGHAFSTKDRDNDKGSRNCAALYKGGWWYADCHHANLNGLYLGSNKSSSTGARWLHWKGNKSMKTTSMKIRRKSNN